MPHKDSRRLAERTRLFRLSAEDLLLQPGDSGIPFFDLLGQFCDPPLLTANGILELAGTIPPGDLSFDGTGVLNPPIVSLLAEPNQDPIDLHAFG